jgi:hypothetical protein
MEPKILQSSKEHRSEMVFDSSTDSYMPELSRALNPEMVCLEAH